MTENAAGSPAAVWLTQKTFDRLTAELRHLEGPAREDVIAKISAARDEGDLKENGGYHAAKDEQGKIEARILQLKEMLASAVTKPGADDRIVEPGMVVTYRYAGDDENEVFLMGARENADDQDKYEVFSPQSPLGAAMLGAKPGETVDFSAPNGKTLKLEIIDAVPYED